MQYSDIKWFVRAVKRYMDGGRVDVPRYKITAAKIVTDIMYRASSRGEFISEADAYDRLLRFIGKKYPHLAGTLDHCRCCNIIGKGADMTGALWGTDGAVVCQECYSLHLVRRCYNCGVLEPESDMRFYSGEAHCASCFDERYGYCESCQDVFPHSRLDGDSLCSNCSDDDDDVDDLILSYGTDATRVHRRAWLSATGEPTDAFGNGKSRRPTLWFGFELEVVAKTSLHSSANAVTKALAGRGILKDDGSIDGDGYEIVSLPGTLRYHQTGWGDEFFATLYKNCAGWDHSSCGMHVHMSRAALSHLQVARMAKFINDENTRSFIEKVAGRSSGQYNRYVPKKITDVQRNYDYRRARDATGLQYHDDGDRRQVVNLTKEGTVEIRLFRSNVSKVGFLKNIEFCDAVANFCRIASSASLTQAAFMDYMAAHQGTYPNFTKWAVRERLMTTTHKPAPLAPEIIIAA